MTMKLSSAAADDLSMFLLDDDEIVTSLDVDAFKTAAPYEQSYVGTLPRSESTSEAVRVRHTALAGVIRSVEQTCNAFDSVDTSAVAAQVSLRRRMGSLAMAAGALESVASFVESPDHEALFAGEGLLAPYLAGVYLWMNDVAETMGALAHDLNTLAPDWAAFRERLDEVRWIFDMALTEAKRLENVIDLLPVEMHEPMDALRIAAVALKHKLDEPFG
jgi:hypothetical protein